MISSILSFLTRESSQDREMSLKAKRLREINSKKIPTMEEENEKRMLIGYPYLLEIVKIKCPKCNGKMWHDNFNKIWDKRRHILAQYNCVERSSCGYEEFFDLFTNKFTRIKGVKKNERHKTRN